MTAGFGGGFPPEVTPVSVCVCVPQENGVLLSSSYLERQMRGAGIQVSTGQIGIPPRLDHDQVTLSLRLTGPKCAAPPPAPSPAEAARSAAAHAGKKLPEDNAH